MTTGLVRTGVAVVLSLGLVRCGNGMGQDSLDLSSTREQLVNAVPDVRERHPRVCTFVAELFPGGPTGVGCTATFIARNAVVTAAHCSQGFPVNPGLNCDAVVGPDSARMPGHYVVHPDNTGSLETIGSDPHDLAVFVLDAPVKSARLARLPWTREADVDDDDDVTVVGYGAPGPFDPSHFLEFLLEPKTRRVGRTRIDAITPDYLQTGAHPTVGCAADSGGPLLVGRASSLLLGTLQVADCVAFSQYVRLDTPAARSFLEQFVTKHD